MATRHMSGWLLGSCCGETHQAFLCAGADVARRRRAAIVTAVRAQLPRRRVCQLHLQNAVESGATVEIQNRSGHFDPPAQVAGSPVRRPDVVLGLTGVGEAGDTHVLGKATGNSYTTNRVVVWRSVVAQREESVSLEA